MPDLYRVRQGEGREDECQDHRGDLGGNHHFLAVHSVGHSSPDGGNEEDGDLAGEPDCAQQ